MGEAARSRRDGHLAARVAVHGVVAGALARFDDAALGALVDAGTAHGLGIGGATALVEVAGTTVFVKQVRLTDLERRPEREGSTANLFGLPAFCHEGAGVVGSPGFGAWRELAVHLLTTGWVLAGEHEGFPLTYHWRVLPDAGRPLPEELADVDRAVASWGGGTAVRRRLEALERSTASLVLFLEYVPRTLHDWLGEQFSAGDDAAGRACARVEDELVATVDFLSARGVLHLDAHFRNVLTDGTRLYVTDYGLAMSADFALDEDEARFLAARADYDRHYVRAHLVSWLTFALLGCGPRERRTFIEACAREGVPEEVPPGVGAVLARHAPTAAVMGGYFGRFQQDGPETPFPRRALDALGGRRVDGQRPRNIRRR